MCPSADDWTEGCCAMDGSPDMKEKDVSPPAAARMGVEALTLTK